jgi:hypothetical protein
VIRALAVLALALLACWWIATQRGQDEVQMQTDF